MDTNHADADDGWLEQALKADAREHAAAYVSDDGFTAKVMARLPAPATLPAWRRPILALLWLIAGSAVAVALPELFYEVFRSLVAMVVGQPLTLSLIAVVIILLAATMWSTIVYAIRAE
ncbi:MAG: hypothetical protein AUH79_07005 [Betaproteobacteria bacterium 13_1_40CM_4_64_4]|nr:MAG: hypothetical protein AUH79_07005 [Betaproteobacteria bacterium 13_1_40CM_4_64_4]